MPARLTQSSINQLTPKEKSYSLFDSVVQGLFVTVHPSGKKIFYIKYKHPTRGKNTNNKIGDASVLSIAQAREKAQALLAQVTLGKEIDRKLPPTSQKLTLAELISMYEENWAAKRPRSRNSVISVMKKNFANFLERNPENLTVLEIEKWQLSLRNRDNPLKYKTINDYTSALKTMLTWAIDRDLITTNPLKKLKKLEQTDSREITRYLTDDERSRLMEALDKRERDTKEARRKTRLHNDKKHLPDLDGVEYVDHIKPLVLIALNTGIRRHALFALNWEDIDFTTETILLRAETAKSKKTVIIPMNSIVKGILRKWQLQTNRYSGLIFPNPQTGKILTNCNSSWEALLKAANIKNFRWHDMRHDFASRLVMKGNDLNTVRELLGHSDIKMTQRYAHLAPERKKTAVNMLVGGEIMYLKNFSIDNGYIDTPEKRNDLTEICNFLLEEYIRIFGLEVMSSENCIIYNDKIASCPMLVTNIQPIRIRLAQEKLLCWAQTIYQLSHELCHYAIRQKKYDKNYTLAWFEEILCEAMSLYALEYSYKNWTKCRLYKRDNKFADNISSYLTSELDRKPSGETMELIVKKIGIQGYEWICSDNRDSHINERNAVYFELSKEPMLAKFFLEYSQYLIRPDRLYINFKEWKKHSDEHHFISMLESLQPL